MEALSLRVQENEQCASLEPGHAGSLGMNRLLSISGEVKGHSIVLALPTKQH